MKKKLLTLLVIGTMIFALASCDMAVLGKWRINQVTAGDVVMTQDDIVEMGLDVGYIKLNRSGSCKLNLVGDEYDGTWTASGEGANSGNTIQINYGDNLNGTATFDDSKVMTFTDSQGATYKLNK